MKKTNKGRGKNPPKSVKLISKPFCDCTRQCCCQTCPDIKKEIGVPIIKTGKDDPGAKRFSKANKKSSEDVKNSIPKNPSKSVVHATRPSLLDVMKNHQECNCEAIARAVRSDVHKNLDLHQNSARNSKDIENKTKPI
ncbi:uncharacterized protein LOC120630144 [Pararge aegeria]|uniref:Jg16344 protein n=1 Tax=Pararge aegeria aegeria TaxID=348720 RepID=A0A8S4RVX2_9NEOP|nr:uncharacterized protein LOC120630144 [Pararge aegeria]CAH2241782.1 jg16344 [Pararge aegeria aegeria]